MSAATEAAIEQLIAAHPTLVPILVEHREENFGGPEDVRDLIAVSGVGMIPDPRQPGADSRALDVPSDGHLRALTSAKAISGDFFPVDVDPGWASSSVG